MAFWRGELGGLGLVELVVPALEVVPVADQTRTCGAMVVGDSVPTSYFTGMPYGGRPRLASGRLNVAGQQAAFERSALRTSRQGRALRIWAVGREYRYAETGNRRHHVLERADARVDMVRSSWARPEVLSGTPQGAVDSVDVSLAVLFEGVYTRNLSLRGALISGPGRLADRLGG
ncbi:hypothetical protein [Streptomyces lancefieldiae]|uniref:Uncharacterized protein n=1 Tax=Streptomyces lancefieldiae TaxID=3075520 RepID=A0ABU3ATU5_9ACTN|nr:hypothetical protein [Streptomyces sp. DSM 40712]MDT0613581.1 hypothetical protein [Streptomyces sp. DSM 40712]